MSSHIHVDTSTLRKCDNATKTGHGQTGLVLGAILSQIKFDYFYGHQVSHVLNSPYGTPSTSFNFFKTSVFLIGIFLHRYALKLLRILVIMKPFFVFSSSYAETK